MADSDSTPGKAPAFQFYPNDFLSDANVIVMSMQERGCYITLICICWQQGSLPSDVERLALLCGLPVGAFRKVWPAVLPCFRLTTNGERLVHPRLERERKKHRAFRKLQSDKGKLGGRPKKPELVQEKAGAFQNESRARYDDKAEKSSSNFKLQTSSSDFSQEKRDRDPVQRVVDRHEELHRQYVGVGYIGNPQKDYTAACDLVRAFPDPTLQDAILTYGLNDADPFMAKGTRTIPRIVSNASKYAEELKARKLA